MYEKIIITKDIIETYSYERLNVLGKGGKIAGTGEYREENYKLRQRERRNAIRRLVTANFDSSSKFVTLTYNDLQSHDITDVKQCNKTFNDFTKRVRRKYPDFRYLAVIEFQDKNGRGAVHYHMICNLPYIKNSDLAAIWGNGFIKITAIDKVDNIGAYVIKYMTSDMDDKRLQGLKAYNRSTGLEKPLEVKSWSPEWDMESFRSMIKDKSPSYCREYESEMAGKVVYSQYNLTRKSTD